MNTYLIILGILIPIIGVLVFAIKTHLKEVRLAKPIPETKKVKTFEELSKVIHTSYSSLDELDQAVIEILLRYSKINDFELYEKLLQKICTHKNSSSKLILKFQRGLIEENKTMKLKLDKTLEIGMKVRKLR